MKLYEYPQVYVQDAPGFSNFWGWRIAEFTRQADDVDLCVVCAEWDGKIETHVFRSQYVYEI